MTGRCWRDGRVLVDIGTSTVTGVRAPGAPELARAVGYVGDPVLRTLALSAPDTALLNSDFARAGLVHKQPPLADDGIFTDPLGIGWLLANGGAAHFSHPLAEADYLSVARYPSPVWPDLVQFPARPAAGAARPLIIADAPVPGLLEMCSGLRSSWQFLLDLGDDRRVVNALLDWALEAVASAYERMLAALPGPPDVVLYGDDYGFQDGMFLSGEDFRILLRPRLRTLFGRIRRATGGRSASTVAAPSGRCSRIWPI